MSEKNGKKIILKAGKKEFEFKVTVKEFNAYQNEFMPSNKVAPSENFLSRCLVNPEQKQDLEEILDQGFALEMAQLLAEEFKPDFEITVKK